MELKEKNSQILFFIILLLAICLRFFYLDKGFNSDEGRLLYFAKADLDQMIPLIKQKGVYPPLSPFLLHFWTKISSAEVWIRGYFVIFGLGVCLVIYGIGKEFLDKRFGLIAFFIAAVSPLLIWASQFVRSYIDSSFWILLSTFFMLKIVKGKWDHKVKLGYVCSSVLSLYSFYLNAFFLILQNIFMMIFWFKDYKKIMKWAGLQLTIALLFSPCILLVSYQIKLATAINPFWSKIGFQIYGLNVGYYARSLAALCGMDPGFLTTVSLTKNFNHNLLLLIVTVALIIFVALLVFAVKNYSALLDNKKLILFFPILSLGFILIYNVMVEVFYFPFQIKYFVAAHALFIFMFSSIIYSYKKYYKLAGIIFLVFLTSMYAFRWADALSPEFETKKAYNYLLSHFNKEEIIITVRNTNYYLKTGNLKRVVLREHMQDAKKTGYYKIDSEEINKILQNVSKDYDVLWFHRTYGNDQVLGANRILMEWFQNNYYKVLETKKFKRIDLIKFKKGS